MLAFACQVCGQLLSFENDLCLRCSTPQGFVPEGMDLVALRSGAADGDAPGPGRRCANAQLAACNWLVLDGDPEPLCRSCRLTRLRPADDDAPALDAFATAEAAKRRLLFELLDLGVPIDESELRFELLSSRDGPVTTGHADGVITIDLTESDPVQREQRRRDLREPYRTLLGHFRHEVSHYLWPILVERPGGEVLDRYRELFGDEREDYGEALDRHYRDGPPADWAERHVSAYATMHSWEDWAETCAHFLHIRDTLQTGAAFGLIVAGPPRVGDPSLTVAPPLKPERGSITSMIDVWLPLTYALNAINRSMGASDLYPFTLAPTVIEKLGFVRDVVVR